MGSHASSSANTSSGSLSSMMPTSSAAFSPVATSLASSSPFVFGTTPAGSTAAVGSTFSPIRSSVPPPLPAPSPRHPIFKDHITNHIKFLLNLADHNYHKWKTFFLMVLVR
ncbi:hypothetical protein ZWY2020_005418 [Hordeum vulgare]|nr:hypothetical protein ZWY2020_005418 [Hordeum vulgare]